MMKSLMSPVLEKFESSLAKVSDTLYRRMNAVCLID